MLVLVLGAVAFVLVVVADFFTTKEPGPDSGTVDLRKYLR
jgi:hypothetical protein